MIDEKSNENGNGGQLQQSRKKRRIAEQSTEKEMENDDYSRPLSLSLESSASRPCTFTTCLGEDMNKCTSCGERSIMLGVDRNTRPLSSSPQPQSISSSLTGCGEGSDIQLGWSNQPLSSQSTSMEECSMMQSGNATGSLDMSPSTSPTYVGHKDIIGSVSSSSPSSPALFSVQEYSFTTESDRRINRYLLSAPKHSHKKSHTSVSNGGSGGVTSALSSQDTLCTKSPTSDHGQNIASPRRHTPPVGKRRVYSCTAEGTIIQTECYFEGTTCIYSEDLAKTREALFKIPKVLPRYIFSLLEQTTYCPFNLIWEVVEDIAGKEEPIIRGCHQQQAVTRNFRVIQSLLRLQRCVANVVHYKVGKLINELSEENKNVPKHYIVTSLCNEAGRAKERNYTSMLLHCSQAGCSQCRAAQLFDSLGRHGPIPVTPCTATQACCRLLEIDYQNFTPTFFRQCADVATLPFYSPVIRSSEAPSCVRTVLAPTAAKLFKGLLMHPPVSLTSGCVPVFPLSADKSAVEAVQYSDGDGGFIVLEHFDFLNEYVHKLPTQPSVVFLREHGYHMLQFRDLYHDAVELGHEYEIAADGEQTRRKYLWGYEALVNARGNIARSARLWLVPASTDASGNRLLIELFTLEAGELMPRSTGIRQLEAGLSHLTRNSPTVYKEAWSRAKAYKTALHKYNLGEISELHPINLKQCLTRAAPITSRGSRQSPVVVVDVVLHDATVICTVKNNPHADYLNEANIWILKSSIRNAGLGLFLKPTVPPRCSICIPPKKSICIYSSEPTTTPLSQMVTTDYLIEVERRGTALRYSPNAYDGRNIGRFINQGGLLEGIREMTFCCDRQRGGRGIEQGRIHKVMEDWCNTAYHISSGTVLHVVALKHLESSSTPTELLVNYTYTYWTRYIASHCKELGFNNPIVSGLLWCYLSRNSAAYGMADFDLTCLPEDVKGRFYDMECPFRQDQRRRV